MRPFLLLPLAALPVACVTINVYFPAAAAEKAADLVIDEVWGKGAAEAPKPGTPVSQRGPGQAPRLMLRARDGETHERAPASLLDFFIPAAQAQVNLDIGGPEIQRLQAAMQARHASLAAHYASGAVGLTADGGIAVRDANAVPLAQRNAVRQLVADETADRNALYREIANANGHPEWEAQIRSTFAQRWAARAQAGWWVQGAAGWAQK